MADVKWIKIVTDIFDDEKMFAIESFPDGHLIELVWFKILCLAGKCNCNGFLTINNKIPYTDEMLSNVFRMELGTVKRAIEMFEQLEMIEVVDNAYMVSNWLVHQSGDRLEKLKEQNRIRQQKHRDKQKNLPEKEEKKEEEKKDNVTDNVTNNVNCSISYSNSKSNIFNLNYLLNTDTNYNYINSNTELKELIEDWLEYKDSKGKHHLHYVEKSMRALLSRFIEYHCKYGLKPLKEAVDKTITNGWVGIVWESVHQTNSKNETTNADWLEKWRNA